MGSTTKTGPFSHVELEEVPLPSAPLLRVICQVRWQTVSRLKYELDSIVQSMALALADEYPLLGERQEVSLIVTPEGVDRRPAGTVHTLGAADGGWSVSITESFLALDTTAYVSRTDFCARLRKVLDCLHESVKIPRIERIGFRYVNRVDNESTFDRLSDLIDPSLLPGEQVPLDSGSVAHSLSETLFTNGDSNLLARWAVLPPGGTIDPTIAASPRKSWVLDLDAFSVATQPLDPAVTVEAVAGLSNVAYRFFRWAVTPAFLEEFGGTP